MISVSEYSDKSFVVNGSTIEFKNKLKELGGKWNPYLKTGPGWIFSNKGKSSVQEWMNNIEKTKIMLSPAQHITLNNEEVVSKSHSLKETVLAIFFVSLIYLYDAFTIYSDLQFNNIGVSLDTYNSPIFLNKTC
jgi:hypothetical protein